jgi:curved DNA-binding protein CbpA
MAILCKILAKHLCQPQSIMPEQVDYYRVLHVSRQATLLEIKKAFRRLARQFHPDLNPNDRAAAAYFQQISAAYGVLGDRQRRAKYDDQLSPDADAQAVKTAQSAQLAYQRGGELLARRDYPSAIAAFDQAILLNPESIEAYLGRCKANEELKNDRAILDDCYKLLQIDPQLALAYYHQGRARFRLGYSQGAVEAYTHAIALQDTFALAYYQRGRILLELKESDRARQDLQKASQLFRIQNDLEQYRQAEALLNRFRPYHQRAKLTLGNGFLRYFAEVATSIPALLQNPSANLQPTFEKLGSSRAGWTGVLYGLITAGCVALGAALLHRSLPEGSLNLVLAVGRFYSALVATGAIVHKFAKGRFCLPESCFLAGATILPMIGWALLGWLSIWLGLIGPLSMAVAGCYSVIILYIGYTQLSKVDESVAMWAVPLTLIISAITSATPFFFA